MKLQQGLKPTVHDTRDFQLGKITTLPDLKDLPESFRLEAKIKNQGSSDFCTAYATCTASEIQEGVELSPEYSFALSKEISGDPDEWGQEIHYALKAHEKVGAIEQNKAPYTLQTKDDTFLRRISNWPDLKNLAIFHKKKSYFKVTGQYDHFDNIRASIYKFKDGVVTGVAWSWPVNAKVLTGTSNSGFGHCIALVGWTPEGIIVHNSAGTNAGENGYHFITRETVNHFVEIYGAYMFVDLSPEEARIMLQRGIQLEQLSLMTKVLILIQKLINKLNVGKIFNMAGEILAGIFSKRN